MARETWLLLDSRGLGGIETHVAELAAGLLAAGESPRVLFLTDYGPHPLHPRLAAESIPWSVVSGGMLGLRRMLRRDRPCVLHTHGYKANIIGRVAALASFVPAIASYHAGEAPRGRLALYDVLDRATSCLGPRIAVSRQILQRLPFGGTLVPNFVAVPDNMPNAGPQVVAFVGRMVAEKGPDNFCELAATLPGVRFAAYGDGPLRAALEQANPGMRFLGAVAGMDAHWRDVGLLVISSRAEGLPLAALEAMAHGVPVAAFGLGGLPELIEDGFNGYLAAPGDTAALQGCVRRWLALEPAARTSMARTAWRSVASGYGRESGVAAIRQVYATA